MSQTNYKHLYEVTRRVLERYQDEILPAFRQEIEQLQHELEQARAERDAVTKRMIELEQEGA